MTYPNPIPRHSNLKDIISVFSSLLTLGITPYANLPSDFGKYHERKYILSPSWETINGRNYNVVELYKFGTTVSEIRMLYLNKVCIENMAFFHSFMMNKTQ